MPYRVLFVDDEPAILDGFRKAFRRASFEVYTAESARAALEVLAEVEIDIVVSDERMPKMPGAEFLSRVRRAHPATIRIMLTGQATIEAAIRAINDGRIYRFLTKPIDAHDLKRLIESALAEAHPEDRSFHPDLRDRLRGALESRHPGITDVKRDAHGAIVLSEDRTGIGVE